MYAILEKVFPYLYGKTADIHLIHEQNKKRLDSLEIVISGIKHSSSRSQTEEFLKLFEKIISRNKEKRIHEKALNFLLTDFGKLHQQVEIRPQVFQLLGNLKMELM